ncbi:MAG: hypothetical protein LBU19_00975 [Treponema sp.]|nr:hypothetical protein [Treponema sp.]
MSTHMENAGGIYPAVCAQLHSPPRLAPGPVYSVTPLCGAQNGRRRAPPPKFDALLAINKLPGRMIGLKTWI